MRPVLLAVAVLAMSPASQAAPRIVSMNICTDQNLLALADPAQIVGLSRFARDGRLGWGESRSAEWATSADIPSAPQPKSRGWMR